MIMQISGVLFILSTFQWATYYVKVKSVFSKLLAVRC